jgi:hypothetical protein
MRLKQDLRMKDCGPKLKVREVKPLAKKWGGE